jgi:hypothetical protein
MMRHAVFAAAFAALLAVVAGAPARAADPVFPVNSRVGLVPPAGFVPSSKFVGFESTEGNVAILVVELPAEAFPTVEKGFADEALKARGLTVEKRDSVELAGGRGFIISGEHVSGTWKRREIVLAGLISGSTVIVSVQIAEEARNTVSEDALRDSLKTTTVRARVPDAEKISILPYKIGDLGGFRIVRSSGDGSALLTDGPDDTVTAVAQPFVLIALVPGETPKAEDRDTFARRVFASIPGIKEVRIQRAEPLRINNQLGYEVLAEAKDASSGTDVTTVQWLRFSGGAYLQVFAIARRDKWAELFPRLRAIRDSLDLR